MGTTVEGLKIAKIMSGDANKPYVVFVLGGPGSGKGTQCEKIAQEFSYEHLSAGDLLRAERNSSGSEFGALIEQHIRDGTIVPVEITCSLLEKAMNISGRNRFLIDGFPRNEDNLQGWMRVMADKVNVQFVIFFDCPKEVCVQRCLDRGKSSGRADDNEESLKKRFVTYFDATMPIIEYYKNLALVKEIDASRPQDEVFEDVKRLFQENLPKS